MKKLLLALCLVSSPLLARETDPFSKITRHRLENGMHANEFSNSWESPFQVLSQVSNEEYVAILKKYANPKHKFQMLSQPEFFFQYDSQFLLGVSSLFFFFLFRTL